VLPWRFVAKMGTAANSFHAST